MIPVRLLPAAARRSDLGKSPNEFFLKVGNISSDFAVYIVWICICIHIIIFLQPMKKEEIKELSIQELKAQIEASEKAYRELKVAHAISPVDNPAKITKDRRDIARLKTVLRQKELAAMAEASAK